MSTQFFPTYEQVLRSKFGGLILDVREYGADPTGVQDSTGAITQCCKDAAAVGAVAYAGPGTFICNGATSPVQDTGYVQLQGAGENLTKFICTQTPAGGGGVFNLQMPGEIADITFDGNGTVVGATPYKVLSVGNGHTGVTWPKVSLRRVTCQNINTSAAWTLVVWMSGSGSPVIDTLILEDVTVRGPSSTVQDAMAINSFNVCYVTRMNLLGLYRSPNFFQGGTLIVNGMYSDGTSSIAEVVFDSGLGELVLSGYVSKYQFTPSVLFGAPILHVSDSVFGAGFQLGYAANSQVAYTSNVEFGRIAATQSAYVMNTLGAWFADNCAINNQVQVRTSTASGPLHFTNCDFNVTSPSFGLFNSNTSAVVEAYVTGGRTNIGANAMFQGCTPNPATAIRGLMGYNPVGPVTVAVPASGTATAALPYDATYYITQATAASSVAVQGQTIDIPIGGPTAIRVPAGETLTPTYTTAPTWVVMGE